MRSRSWDNSVEELGGCPHIIRGQVFRPQSLGAIESNVGKRPSHSAQRRMRETFDAGQLQQVDARRADDLKGALRALDRKSVV